MKNKFTLLTACFLISFMAANAQFTTGKYLIGGYLSFQTENGKDLDYKNDGAVVNLSFGKVIKENTVVGINLSYGQTSYDYVGSHIQKSKQYGAGVFYRKYKTLSKDFHLFGEAGLDYSYSENKNTDGSNIQSNSISNSATIHLMPGLSYSLNNKVQIELLMPNIVGIGYSHSTFKNTYPGGSSIPDKNKSAFVFSTNLNYNLLSNFGIGFKFLLGK